MNAIWYRVAVLVVIVIALLSLYCFKYYCEVEVGSAAANGYNMGYSDGTVACPGVDPNEIGP